MYTITFSYLLNNDKQISLSQRKIVTKKELDIQIANISTELDAARLVTTPTTYHLTYESRTYEIVLHYNIQMANRIEVYSKVEPHKMVASYFQQMLYQLADITHPRALELLENTVEAIEFSYRIKLPITVDKKSIL